MRYTLLLTLLTVATYAAEIKTTEGDSVSYDEIIVSPSTPITFVTLKSANGVRVLKYSEVELASLPNERQAETAAYMKKQLEKRMILKNDKWMHRDEMLLNQDPRYAAKGRLAKIGKSIINFHNTTEQMVTIGVRSADRGYEMHIEPGKKKGYQVPNGRVYYIMAQESADGKQLIVQKSKPENLNNVRLQVTIYTSDKIPADELGTIDIPAEYQVRE